jgi:hypothetical protein
MKSEGKTFAIDVVSAPCADASQKFDATAHFDFALRFS